MCAGVGPANSSKRCLWPRELADRSGQGADATLCRPPRPPQPGTRLLRRVLTRRVGDSGAVPATLLSTRSRRRGGAPA